MTVKKLTNVLVVDDVRETARFYCDNFKFEIVLAVPSGSEDACFSFEDGVSYAFAILSSSNVELMIQSKTSIEAEFTNGVNDLIQSKSMIYIEVDDVEEIFSKINKDIEIVKGLHETFYGMKEFYIKDPDGNTLGLASKL